MQFRLGPCRSYEIPTNNNRNIYFFDPETYRIIAHVEVCRSFTTVEIGLSLDGLDMVIHGHTSTPEWRRSRPYSIDRT